MNDTTINAKLIQMGEQAVKVSRVLTKMNVGLKNQGLEAVADALIAREEEILWENRKDIEKALSNNMKESLVDRLCLTSDRIVSMAEGLRQIASLEDPVGEVIGMKKRPNGLMIGEKRVPLGVIGIIYEARPNVTADAFGLCFKTGNAVILKGGSDALYSNIKIVEVIQQALIRTGIPGEAVQLIKDTDREVTRQFMGMDKYIDVLIPRGSAGLIQSTIANSTIPVIETGTGNCHVYVDETADIQMAADIIYNAKTQRTGVCNACESLVIHSGILKDALPVIAERLSQKNVEIRADERARMVVTGLNSATIEDWGTEYLDYIISVKTVDSIDEAIDHINCYNTKHSEAIITKDYANANRFLEEVDAAAVYVNASTRFTDGFEFGFGAEIGISTQKLHARGPMGLKALTTTKFIIYGNGQTR
ncbi:glutamate-5-semialdehyde dehydrogenase [Parasporobacterium paucivorans]|uniref:Gamma-glutamyl phosphate reductase n=1 Tax=Parasporobacterium paucivorans DSM 15970 TaxID=1122934 RepID=A0A1M6A1S4_9FIRM|nr:glutamate-5-semialdehyde dehydrogenase [Parasporobacterium paucivorans]SHI30447.1 glutamate-5-semialdehyde dehydrogenase [Parasporobacterium paucivorans DSM 15970]